MWNSIKTALLLATLSGLLMLTGYLVGGVSGMKTALFFSILINLGAYFFSDKIVLNMYRAKPLDRAKYPQVYQMVQQLCKHMNIPMPKLWFVDQPIANAFATGRNPQNASIALTAGILDLLNEEELRGVIAHELSHVKNRDILVGTIAATLASAIGYMANMARYAAYFGRYQHGGDRQRTNPLSVLVVSLFMPVAAALIQLSVSRTREYLADESGADFSHDPLALAAALEKLEAQRKHVHLRKNDLIHASTASLFIVNPFWGEGWISLFSTHPPMKRRIAILREIHKKMMEKQ